MNVKITILGCGNSAGVPMIGNYWGQCDPAEPRNRRTRPSIAIESADTTIIVDTGADFKQQINRENIQRINAVIYTHAHSDHVHGIDDLRVFRLRSKQVVPIYSNKATLDEIQERFAYMFTENGPEGIYPRAIDPNIFTEDQFGQTIMIGDIVLIPFEQMHGVSVKSIGLRIGDLAYSTDVTSFDEKALKTLAGIKTWIIDSNGYMMPHNHVHMTLKAVFEVNKIVGAEQVYLTHMPGFMDYQTLLKELPPGYAPAYDGMTLEAII